VAQLEGSGARRLDAEGDDRKKTRIMAAAVLLAAGALVLQVVQAQQQGITRSGVMRLDLSAVSAFIWTAPRARLRPAEVAHAFGGES
jgi:hypothetical protein